MKKNLLTEDWTVVLLGFIIIGVALLGVKIPSPSFGWETTVDLSEKVLTAGNLIKLGQLFVFTFVIALLAASVLGKSVASTAKGFPIVFVLTSLALVLAGNAFLKNWNLEAVIFSLTIGLVLSNFFTLPAWLTESLSTELFVKIGLILLGTSVIFGDILKAGSLGLIQALVVVISVWYFAFWVSKKMGIDEEFAIMISSAVSICGVSAAIATSGAIKGDSKKLSYVISIVLITAIPMIIFLPFIAQALGLSQAVTGAWLGGTIDTTGAVIASGTMVGEEALKISTIVKFSQNVLLGFAAFAISIYWTVTNNQSSAVQEAKPTVSVIWERFPKFVLGFIAASLLFSFVISSETLDSVKGGFKALQGLWFALAFTSIGLETKFSDLFSKEGKKPLYAFLIAQLFNVFVTLAVAYVLFS
ncbi:YeiH family protein [Aquirufa antheringensis]|uniref:Putative sulfate exporter family transporter n=1 Tax=Aquirufa antheringensis TaxID=2516559 RepID=A0A4Q9BHL6_9BACT|nr:putative sulfate exporter family transporter [Aquirufa antheringensis]MCZ2485026.1 putative sulfate exporter family transporter [Aquirufa antheringensis]TBH75331.1 putative sulfate exporter family transporter [Aquirufa antheringensis]